MGFFFLFLLVPLGALLANYPGPIAEWLSSLLGVEITRGNLGAGFMLLAAICLNDENDSDGRAMVADRAALPW
jgi:hypothetical protein